MAFTATQAEITFSDGFRKMLHDERNPELRELREQAFGYFKQVGFPTRKDEDWKYTDVSWIEDELWHVAPMSQPPSSGYWEELSGFNFRRNGFTALHLALA